MPTSPSIKVLRPIFLIGLSGGRQVDGGRCCWRRSWSAASSTSTRVIEEEAHQTIAEIFFNEREAGFRAREAAALRRVTAQGPQVIAVGGGAPAHGDNMDFMLHAGRSCCLTADAPTSWCAASATPRRGRCWPARTCAPRSSSCLLQRERRLRARPRHHRHRRASCRRRWRAASTRRSRSSDEAGARRRVAGRPSTATAIGPIRSSSTPRPAPTSASPTSCARACPTGTHRHRHRRHRVAAAPAALRRRAARARTAASPPSSCPTARARSRSRRAEELCESFAREGLDRGARHGRARRRRRRRPGRLRGVDLPARRPLRAGADDAVGAGRLVGRRQDRRQPAGGQEPGRHLLAAAPRLRRRDVAGDAVGARRCGRPGRGHQARAHRRRRRCSSCSRRDAARARAGEPELLAELVARSCAIKARVVGDRRARDHRARARCSTSATPSATRSSRRRAPSANPLRHGEAVALGMLAAARIAAAAGRRRARGAHHGAARRRRPADRSRSAASRPARSRASRSTRSAAATTSASSSSTSRGARA